MKKFSSDVLGEDGDLASMRSWRITKTVYLAVLTILSVAVMGANSYYFDKECASVLGLVEVCNQERQGWHFDETMVATGVAVFLLGLFVGTRLLRRVFRYIVFGQQ